MLARLKPHNPKRGNLLQQYSAGGYRFRAGDPFTAVPDDLAQYLKGVTQIPDDPDTNKAFDVGTEAEVAAMLLAEGAPPEPPAVPKVAVAPAGAEAPVAGAPVAKPARAFTARQAARAGA